jgi:hypothetical protein
MLPRFLLTLDLEVCFDITGLTIPFKGDVTALVTGVGLAVEGPEEGTIGVFIPDFVPFRAPKRGVASPFALAVSMREMLGRFGSEITASGRESSSNIGTSASVSLIGEGTVIAPVTSPDGCKRINEAGVAGLCLCALAVKFGDWPRIAGLGFADAGFGGGPMSSLKGSGDIDSELV